MADPRTDHLADAEGSLIAEALSHRRSHTYAGGIEREDCRLCAAVDRYVEELRGGSYGKVGYREQGKRVGA